MRIDANNYEEYLEQIPAERKEPLKKLRDVIKENLPEGFEEKFANGFICSVCVISYRLSCKSKRTMTFSRNRLTKKFYRTLPSWNLCF